MGIKGGYALFLFVLFAFSFGRLNAQDHHFIDSLKGVLEEEVDDSVRMVTFTLLARHYQNSDSILTTKYAEKARELAFQIKDPKSVVLSLIPLANLNRDLGNYEVAREFSEKIINLSDEINFSLGKGIGYNVLGNIANRQGDFDNALGYCKKSLHEFTITEHQQGIASVSNSIGLIHMNIGMVKKAMEYFIDAIKLFEKISDLKAVAKITNNIGIIYKKKQEYEKALEYYNRSLHLNDELNNVSGKSNVLNNIGSAYLSMGEYLKSISYFNQSLEIHRQIGNKVGIANLHLNLGEALAGLGKHEEAILEYDSARLLFEKVGDEEGRCYVLYDKGNSLKELGKTQRAQAYLEECIDLSKKIKSFSILVKATGIYAELEQGLGNYKKAYYLSVKHKKLSDSLKNANSLKEVANLEFKYEYEKKELELLDEQIRAKLVYEKALQEKKFFQRLVIIVFVSIFLITIIIGRAYILIRRKKSNLEKVNQEINSRNTKIEFQKNNLKAELKDKELLMSEIHHRTKNNLLLVQNLLSAQLMKTENNKVRTALDAIRFRLESIRLIYEILHQNNTYDSISLSTYLEMLSKKLLEGFSNAENVKIDFKAENISVNKDVIVTIGLIVNEILTNSFKHAFKETRMGKVTIAAKSENNFLKINISDNGIGIPLKSIKKESLGMRLVDGLSKQLMATYSIVNDFGTKFYLEIPTEFIEVRLNNNEWSTHLTDEKIA
ncbi:MAG: tetratricopeptide repeat protein [Bacteroidota bacterium]